MSDSLGLTLLKEGVVTPAELVEAHKLCGGELRGYERAPVMGALVAAIERFRQAQHEVATGQLLILRGSRPHRRRVAPSGSPARMLTRSVLR